MRIRWFLPLAQPLPERPTLAGRPRASGSSAKLPAMSPRVLQYHGTMVPGTDWFGQSWGEPDAAVNKFQGNAL